MKKAIFRGTSLEDIKDFPEAARKDAGFAIDDVQHGRMPSDFKSMTDVGQGVYEVRIEAFQVARVHRPHPVFQTANAPTASRECIE